MRQEFFNLELNTNSQILYQFTSQTNKWVKDNEFNNGIINISNSTHKRFFNHSREC